ncbi:hypothetical protein BGZ76_010704 [Entomortierella beljakovae]|nr:hypothetical protein BGZ76_010704 [Entomortierella beljakovae]
MVYTRGPSKRMVTIILGLCIFFVLYSFTPYSDNSLNPIPNGWPGGNKPLTLEQEEELYRKQEQDRQKKKEEYDRQYGAQTEEQLEKERLKEEQKKEEHDIKEVNSDKVLFENSDNDKTEDTNQNNNNNNNNNDDDKDNSHPDNLPTEFNEALFPVSHQKLLDETIGIKQMNDYFNERSQAASSRDSAIAYSLGQANIAYRNTSVYSVVIKPKSKIPPSGDIHDYTSLARYFWKNPNTPDGLPYLRLDGKPNPDMDSVWDYRLLRKVFRDCYFMGQAYFWTGDERYAEKIVFRVNEWFLDEETHMNPNVKYASLIFGNQMGRAQGVLDMFKVFGMFDALKAIEGSKAMKAQPDLIPNLQKWFTSYLEWVDGSVQAQQEKNARNNHGTYFTVQEIAILEFLGRNDEAKTILENCKDKRIGSQIREDGAQPHETFRPISFFYSTFNLQGLMMLGIQAQTHNVDLWHYKGAIESGTIRVNAKVSYNVTVGGGTIEDAIRYVSEYAVKDLSEWPYPDTGSRNLADVLKMARMASVIYGRDKWLVHIENLEAKIDEETPDEASEEGEGGEKIERGDPNSFICDLGILSNGKLWHCYK